MVSESFFSPSKLKTQNNFLKKFRLRSKKKEEMIDGEIEALKMTEKGNTKVGGILLSAISSKTLVDENEKNENENHSSKTKNEVKEEVVVGVKTTTEMHTEIAKLV